MPRKSTTRGAQGAGNIRKRTDGTWEARYTLGRDPGTGKQIQKSVYGKTQAEVRKKLQDATKAIDEGTYMEPSKMTFGEWLDYWVDNCTLDIKESSRDNYKGKISSRIKPGLGAVKVSALTALQIQEFYNDTLTGADGKPKMSAKSIKDLHGVIHAALSQAVKMGMIRYNPADACKLPRAEKSKVKPMDDKQIMQFLKAIEGNPYELIFKIDLFTGMRLGEITGLTWDCVDFKTGNIRIEKQLLYRKKVHSLESLKNDRPRTITAPPYVLQLLKRQKAIQAQQQLIAGSLWDNQWNLVFTNELGRYLTKANVSRSAGKVMKQLGYESTRFHDIRHSYAVAAIKSGDDIKTVQDNLGHHTAAFTLDVYGHVTEQMKQDSANRMEHFIKSLSGENL